MQKVIFGSCDKQEDKKYATKQERKFYLFRDDVFYHGALDENKKSAYEDVRSIL